MADVQRIVDEVRFRLQSADCELSDELKRLADEYFALCHEVNGRLRRCGEFLKQGLRAEAVQLADAAPDLLEMFAIVDFPERAEWDDILGIYQVPRPEPLLSDVAEQLNEAYAIHRPLEQLLDRHRLLVLSRAPLLQRLTVMKKLADADADSPIWEADVRSFEAARINEIEVEAQAAAAREDGDALFALVRELLNNKWRQKAPTPIVQSVRQLALQSIAEQLTAAHSTNSFDSAKLLRDRWNELSSQERIASTDRFSAKVNPALKWLAGEEARVEASRLHHDKLTALQRLLVNSKASVAELELARREVLADGREIPEPLAGMLYSRLTEIKRTARNRRRQVVGAAGIVVIVAIGLVSFLNHSSRRANAAKKIVDDANYMIGHGDLSHARQLLDQNRWMSKSERYLSLYATLTEAEKKESVRVAEFEAAIARARSATTPQKADVAIQDAERLARTMDERALVDAATTTWNLKAQEVAAVEEERFQQQLSEGTDLLDRLEDLHQNGPRDSAFLDLLKTAEKKLAELRRTAAQIKPGLARHVDTAESRLARIHNGIGRAEKRTALLERLTRESSITLNQPDLDTQIRHFAAALREYSEAFPGDPKSKDFLAASNEAEIWLGVVAWQQLIGHWKTSLPRNLADVKARIAECEMWLGAYMSSPTGPLMRRYVSYLRHVAAREEDDSGDEKEGIRSKLLRLFSGPLIDDVQVVEFKDGKVYYVMTPFEGQKSDKIVTFRHVVGFSGETKQKVARVGELKSLRSREAPQSKTGKTIRATLNRASITNWDDSLLEIAESLRGARELNPFLRYYLLLRTLQHAKDGSVLLQPELEPTILELHDEKISLSTRWMNPEDSDATRVNQLAENKLMALGALRSTWSRGKEREKEIENQVIETVFPIGWLSLDDHNRWRCLSKWAPMKVYGLWTVILTVGDQAAKWQRIGDADPQNGVTTSNDASQHLREGRLVFARSITIGGNGTDGK